MSRLLIRTASNAYFPQKLSVISMPDRGREVHAAVGQLWDGYLKVVTSVEVLRIVKGMELSPPASKASPTTRSCRRSRPGDRARTGRRHARSRKPSSSC